MQLSISIWGRACEAQEQRYILILWKGLVYNYHTGVSCWDFKFLCKNSEDSWEQNLARLITFAQYAA